MKKKKIGISNGLENLTARFTPYWREIIIIII